MTEDPKSIWARGDRATVYMDGSSPLVASTREFRGATEYVRADLYEEAMNLAQLAASTMENADD